MTTIAVDPNTNDIIIDSSGCLSVVDGCDEIIQCIKQNILSSNLFSFFPITSANRELISATVQSAIASTNGVIAFNSFNVTNDNFNCGIATGLRIEFSVLTSCGIIDGVV